MEIVICISVIALFLTYLESSGQLRNGMAIGFVLLTTLGAIHYDYGNDYMSYVSIYDTVTNRPFSWQEIFDGVYYREPGWVLLCWLFKPIGGFFMLVAVLSILQNYIVYRIISRYVKKSWWTFAIFIYIFVATFYLLSFSMMRQSLVMYVFLGLWPLISQRKWVVPLIILYICSFIHSSAFVLLPFVFWGYLPMKNGWLIGTIYLALLLALWFSQSLLGDIFTAAAENEVVGDYAKTYKISAQQTQSLQLGLGFVIHTIPLILSIRFLILAGDNYTADKKSLVALALIANLITPFASISPLIGRISSYFMTYNIVSLPIVYGFIKNINARRLFLGLYVLITLYSYRLFFSSEIWVDKYTVFHTIFSQL